MYSIASACTSPAEIKSLALALKPLGKGQIIPLVIEILVGSVVAGVGVYILLHQGLNISQIGTLGTNVGYLCFIAPGAVLLDYLIGSVIKGGKQRPSLPQVNESKGHSISDQKDPFKDNHSSEKSNESKDNKNESQASTQTENTSKESDGLKENNENNESQASAQTENVEEKRIETQEELISKKKESLQKEKNNLGKERETLILKIKSIDSKTRSIRVTISNSKELYDDFDLKKSNLLRELNELTDPQKKETYLDRICKDTNIETRKRVENEQLTSIKQSLLTIEKRIKENNLFIENTENENENLRKELEEVDKNIKATDKRLREIEQELLDIDVLSTQSSE